MSIMKSWWTMIAVAGLAITVAFVVIAPEAPMDPMAGHSHLAFLKTAVALSLLPLGMVGGLGLWIWKQARERVDLEDFGDDEERP
jgi:hypothetical protein